jgi:murein DD-endopeptidase MepM/ murein hydrolase activator NlpD
MKKRRRLLSRSLVGTGLFVFFVLMFSSCRGPSTPPPDEEPEPDTPAVKLLYGLDVTNYHVIDSVVPVGAIFGGLMGAMGVSGAAIHEMVVLSDTIFDLRRMRAGNRCLYISDPQSEPSLRWFVYHVNRVEFVVFDFGVPMQIWRGALDVDTVRNEYSGIIRSSLWNAMVADGKNPNLILELSDIFAWVIDFYGIQKGDRFKVIYDELFVEGEHLGIGTIHAAWFEHNYKPYYAFRYEQDSVMQYFDHEGVSLRREFLKAPLQFSRISSHFSHSRMHPILRYRRPHHGVDYAAPSGTPVRTIGDGTVLEARYARGAGNMVKIRHNSTYTTVYMHLRGFAKGIRSGAKVGQGDLIGYVGSTGLSTGPHLDFRVYKNGSPINPLTLESPPAEPIHPDKLEQYKEEIAVLKKALDRIESKTMEQ